MADSLVTRFIFWIRDGSAWCTCMGAWGAGMRACGNRRRVSYKGDGGAVSFRCARGLERGAV